MRRRTVLRGMGTLPLLGALPWLAGCGKVGPVAAGTQAEGWLPAPGAMPGSLLVVDLNGVPLHTQVAVAIVQGLVNRRLRRGGEGVYVLLPSNYVGGVAFQGADPRWLDIYRRRYHVQAHSGTPADAFALAKRLGVDHYIVWNPSLPATINVANTLAWIHGAAAVDPADAHSVMRGPLAALTGGLDLAGHGWKPLMDLGKAGFANATAAYRYALQQLGGQAPGALAFISVGDMQSDATERVLRWTPRDYAVMTRAFTWIGDMNRITAGSHGGVLTDVLRRVAAQRFTAFGWTNNEAQQTIFCSSHGVNFVGADTPGLSAENLSVHTAIATTAAQRPRPAAPALDPEGIYVSVVVTDGDNISVLIDFHEGRWLDPARGKVPLGWSMQGMAPGWTPGIARHYFDTATPNDEMVAWLPFGYPDLPSFVGRPHWKAYVASAQAAMRSGRLRVGQTLPHGGPVRTPQALGLWDFLHGADAPDGFVLGYITVGGYPAEPLWVNGRPILPVGGYGGSGATPSAQAIAAVQRLAASTSVRPLFLTVALGNGTRYADAVRVARAGYPSGVRFVLPGQLVDLARAAWKRGLARSVPVGTPARFGVRDTYYLRLAADDGGSSGGVYLRDGVARQLRQAADGHRWTYGFNVEGCHAAGAALLLTGAGGVEIRADGGQWQTAGSVEVPWGQVARLAIDWSSRLPAALVSVRCTAAAKASFALLDGAVHYNARPAGAALPAKAAPAPSGFTQHLQIPATNPAEISLVLGGKPTLDLRQVGAHLGDSNFHLTVVGGRMAAVFDPNRASPTNPVSYLYFAANVPGWTYPRSLDLSVDYWDAPSGGTLHASYNTPAPGIAGAYASAGSTNRLSGAGGWKTVTWTLSRADFTGRQNNGADFRLSGSPGVAVQRIRLAQARG